MWRWVAGFSLLMLVGCASPKHDGIVLRIANWGGAGQDDEFQRQINKINHDFESAHPGVTVQIEGIPGEYVQKMLLNHIAGAMPDVMVVDASSASIFIDNGILADLTPYYEKEPGFKDQYWPSVLQVYARGSQQFGLPNDFTPMVMYYNKELFDKAGVPYPDEHWTFEDFRAAAKKLTKGNQYGFSFTNWMPGWVMWLWNNGGDVLSKGDEPRAEGTLDSDANVETIQFLRDLIVKDKASPSLSQTAALGVDLFANGKAAMTVSGHWSLVSYKPSKDIDWKRIGVVPLPSNLAWVSRGPRGGSQTVLYMSAYGIPKEAKHKELAWEYVKHWTTYAVQSEYNKSGIAVCARKDVAEQRAKSPVDGPIEASFLPIIPRGRPPYGSFIKGYESVEKQGQAMMDTILNNPDRDIKLELTKAARKIDWEFSKSK